MGIFDFVKDAGDAILKKIGLDDSVDIDDIKSRVAGANISIKDLSVAVADDVAKIGGEAETQSDNEKTILVVGNTKGIAQVEDAITVPTPEPEAHFYTVVSGDNLSKIAKHFYGSANKYPVIFEANKPMLSDPDKIYPGQNLRIPPLS
jgi:nucleoid-associated protein YgaU